MYHTVMKVAVQFFVVAVVTIPTSYNIKKDVTVDLCIVVELFAKYVKDSDTHTLVND